jgi:NADPH:quinone reductase-like Zn-dependent oxidoreductase
VDGDLGPAVRQVTRAGADALLDTASIGGAALAAVRDGGRYVTVTGVPSPERGISVSWAFGRMDEPGLTSLVEMASNGRLHNPVARVFEAAEARRAYGHFSGWHRRGRTVLSFT